MKIERKTQESNEISTSSLPDIIFMLLIFFMVTTVMREFDGLDVLMPRAKMIEKLESKRHTSYVWATKDKLISVDDLNENQDQNDEDITDPSFEMTADIKSDLESTSSALLKISVPLSLYSWSLYPRFSPYPFSNKNSAKYEPS